MPSLARAAIAIAVAAVSVVGLAWLDATVLGDARLTASATFNSSSYLTLSAVAYVLVASAILLVAALGWWSRSVVAGGVYAVAGAFLVLMPALAVNRDLPDSVAQFAADALFRSTGPTFAVEMLGGGLLVGGLVVLGRSVISRSRSTNPIEPSAAFGA